VGWKGLVGILHGILDSWRLFVVREATPRSATVMSVYNDRLNVDNIARLKKVM